MKCYKLVPMTLLLSGLYLNAYGLMSNQGTSSLQEKKLNFVHNSLKAEKADVKSLQVQMTKLEQLVASLDSQLSQVKTDSWNESDGRNVSQQTYTENEEEIEPLAIIQQAERIEEQRQVNLENIFAHETVDKTWSDESNKLINSVLDNDLIKNTNVLESQCHSTLCRLEVQHQDVEDLANFETFLPFQIGESFSELTMHNLNGKDGEVSTVIYLAREGYHLPNIEMDETINN